MNGLLLDENLPRRLTFAQRLPVVHASQIGKCPSDTRLWNYARRESLVIVTKDADFSQRIMLSEPPPWIVWIRFGNMRRQQFHETLARLWGTVEGLLPSHKLIQVHRDRIEAVRRATE